MDFTPPVGRRPRLLLQAYSCSPVRGSEPGVGWNRALAAAKHCDTWVLCREETTGVEVREYLNRHGPIPGLTFILVPNGRFISTLMKVPGCYYLGYRLWHRRAYQVARELHREVGFDLAHLVTFCSYREPGYLADLGIPFVWGPWGGTSNFPMRFLGELGLFGAVSETLRGLANSLQLRLSGRIHRAARRSAAVLANNTTVRDEFASVVGLTPEVMASNGIAQVAGTPRRRRDDGRVRILWSGQLQPFKGLPLLLRALAQLQAGLDWEARILGTGSASAAWQRLAQRMGIADRVRWLGWVPYQEVTAQYAWADQFVFTSLRDTFPTVILEALAQGLPVICLDHQGMKDIVTPDCGVKVPVTNPAGVVAGFRQAITDLAHDPARWEALSDGAIARAREFLWPHLAEQLQAVYERVLTAHAPRETHEPATAVAATSTPV